MQTGRVIIITGPTAVGKTAVALRLAELLNGEIISADSVQIYRGFDVGSDKAYTRDSSLAHSPIVDYTAYSSTCLMNSSSRVAIH